MNLKSIIYCYLTILIKLDNNCNRNVYYRYISSLTYINFPKITGGYGVLNISVKGVTFPPLIAINEPNNCNLDKGHMIHQTFINWNWPKRPFINLIFSKFVSPFRTIFSHDWIIICHRRKRSTSFWNWIDSSTKELYSKLPQDVSFSHDVKSSTRNLLTAKKSQLREVHLCSQIHESGASNCQVVVAKFTYLPVVGCKGVVEPFFIWKNDVRDQCPSTFTYIK